MGEEEEDKEEAQPQGRSKPKDGESKPKVKVEVRADGKVYVEGELREPCFSKGSEGHAEGTCRPCAWYWKDPVCNLHENCSFCHMCLPGELKKRRLEVVRLKKAQNADKRRLDEAQNPEKRRLDGEE